MGKPVRDLAGQRFGRLVVIEPAGSKHGHMIWRCECDCGRETEAYRGSLTQGHKRSCGCLHDEGRPPIHGFAGKGRGKVYNTWKGIKQRCHNPRNQSYKTYGARGIVVCREWRDSFEAFYRDMGEPPTPEHTIERKNNDDGYNPDNCCWATRKVQGKNKREADRKGSKNGRSMLSEDDIRAIRLSSLSGTVLAKAYGVTKTTISQIRLRQTWRHLE